MRLSPVACRFDVTIDRPGLIHLDKTDVGRVSPSTRSGAGRPESTLRVPRPAPQSPVELAPTPLSNGDFNPEYAYKQLHYSGGVSLALGTVPFRWPLL